MVSVLQSRTNLVRRLACAHRRITWVSVTCAWLLSSPISQVLLAHALPKVGRLSFVVVAQALPKALTLYVSVKDAKGSGMGGVTVTVQPGNLRQVTNERGDCEFAGLAIGKYDIIASREGHVTVTNGVTLDTNELFVHEITLTPLPPQADIKGEILKVLEQYRGAYEKKDVDGIREVFPAAPKAFEQQFNAIKSVSVAFLKPAFTTFDADAGKAVVVVGLKQQTVPAPSTEMKRAEFGFEKLKGSDRWVISSVLYFRQ